VTTIGSIYPSTQRQITNWLLRPAKYLMLAIAPSQAAHRDHCSPLSLSCLSFRRRAKRRSLLFAVLPQPLEKRLSDLPVCSAQQGAAASNNFTRSRFTRSRLRFHRTLANMT